MDAIVRRITAVGTNPQSHSAEVLFEHGGKRRKSSRLLKPVEKLQRRVLEAHQTLADETSRIA